MKLLSSSLADIFTNFLVLFAFMSYTKIQANELASLRWASCNDYPTCKLVSVQMFDKYCNRSTLKNMCPTFCKEECKPLRDVIDHEKLISVKIEESLEPTADTTTATTTTTAKTTATTTTTTTTTTSTITTTITSTTTSTTPKSIIRTTKTKFTSKTKTTTRPLITLSIEEEIRNKFQVYLPKKVSAPPKAKTETAPGN